MDLSEIVGQLKASTDTFGPFVRSQAERIPDQVALKFEQQQLTYSAYNELVNRLASLLRGAGATAGAPVAIFCLNSPLFLAAVGAVAKLGAIGALINTHVTGDGLMHALNVSKASIGIADSAALPALHDARAHGIRFFIDADPGATLPPDARPLRDVLTDASAAEPDIPDVRGGDLFLYIYTSGTTGYPKASLVRHLRFTM